MSDNDEVLSGTGVDMPLTESEAIANDIRWAFRTTNDYILTTEEISSKIDADREKIEVVLNHMHAIGEVESRKLNNVVVWWPSH